jgi:hypothetical protein
MRSANVNQVAGALLAIACCIVFDSAYGQQSVGSASSRAASGRASTPTSTTWGKAQGQANNSGSSSSWTAGVGDFKSASRWDGGWSAAQTPSAASGIVSRTALPTAPAMSTSRSAVSQYPRTQLTHSGDMSSHADQVLRPHSGSPSSGATPRFKSLGLKPPNSMSRRKIGSRSGRQSSVIVGVKPKKDVLPGNSLGSDPFTDKLESGMPTLGGSQAYPRIKP